MEQSNTVEVDPLTPKEKVEIRKKIKSDSKELAAFLYSIYRKKKLQELEV